MSASPAVSRRRAAAGDDAFIDALLREAAAEVLAAVPDDMRPALSDLQVRAARSGHALAWPAAVDWILEVDGRPVGRLLLVEGGDSVHVVDVRVAVRSRNRGIGTAALGRVCDQAAAAGLPVTLRVTEDNPAVSLYRRLGFAEVRRGQADGASVVMVRLP